MNTDDNSHYKYNVLWAITSFVSITLALLSGINAILELWLTTLLDQKQNVAITIVATAISMVSAYKYLLKTVKKEIIKHSEMTVNLLCSVKAYDKNGKDMDLIRKLIKVQLGETIINTIMSADKDFPIAVAPGGNVAMTMTQDEYGNILSSLLEKCNKYWQVNWTTVVPVENWTALPTENFKILIAKWNQILNGKQIIMLSNKIKHALSINKYSKSGNDNTAMLNYLGHRYINGVRL